MVLISLCFNAGCSQRKLKQTKSEISKNISDERKARSLNMMISEIFNNRKVTRADLETISLKQSVSIYVNIRSKYLDDSTDHDSINIYERDWIVLMAMESSKDETSIWKVWPDVVLITSPE